MPGFLVFLVGYPRFFLRETPHGPDDAVAVGLMDVSVQCVPRSLIAPLLGNTMGKSDHKPGRAKMPPKAAAAETKSGKNQKTQQNQKNNGAVGERAAQQAPAAPTAKPKVCIGFSPVILPWSSCV